MLRNGALFSRTCSIQGGLSFFPTQTPHGIRRSPYGPRPIIFPSWPQSCLTWPRTRMPTSAKAGLRPFSQAMSRKPEPRSYEVGWKSSAPPRHGSWRQPFDGPLRPHKRRSNNSKHKAKSFRERFALECVTSLHRLPGLRQSLISPSVAPSKSTTQNLKSNGATVVCWLAFIDGPSSRFGERFKPFPLQISCGFCSDGSTSLPPPGSMANPGSGPSSNNWRDSRPRLPPGSLTYSAAAWPITGRTRWITFVCAESSRGDG